MINQAEQHGTKHARPSALDGIPRHLPALLHAEKLVKKARKANVLAHGDHPKRGMKKGALSAELFSLAQFAQQKGWSAEELLRREIQKRERRLRKIERTKS